MQQLAGNSGFVQAALSSEIGAPGWESVSEHAPQAVGVSEIVAAQALPENMTDGESCDTDASAVRVSESLFALPDNVQKAVETAQAPTQTVDGAPVKQLTITGQKGGYPGQDGVYLSMTPVYPTIWETCWHLRSRLQKCIGRAADGYDSAHPCE